jgi:hypothetical protein
MALTSNKLIHMRSAVPGAVPTALQLGVGQIAINTADKKIFIQDSTGAIDTIASAAAVVAAGTAVQSINSKTGTSITLGAADIGTYGVAPLDVNGLISTSNLPPAVLGALDYQGTYNAATNTPALPAATTNKGNYWVVSAAGTQQGLTLAVGDWVLSDGTAYERLQAQNAVSSVNGQVGAVVLTSSDVNALDLTTGGTVAGATTFSVPLTVATATTSGEATNLGQVEALISGLGTGSVTSVAMSVPSFLSVTGSPITTSGTLAVSLATQTANTVFAGPGSGSAADPTFRALVAADIPELSLDEGTYA